VAELAAIDLAGIDNPQATTEQRMQSATLRVFQTKVTEATFIDLDLEELQQGVGYLEALGLLAIGRAAEIINNAIEPGEQYV
jgi:hypothetical protein